MSLATLNAKNSRERYAAIWRNFDRDLTAEGIRSYIVEKRDGGYAPATVNLHLAALKFLARESAAAEELPGIEAIKSLPVRGVRMGTWLSLEQVTRLLDYGIPNLTAARDRCLLALLTGCALRRSEVASLQIGHVQTLDGRVVLLDLVGKGRRVRTVPVPSWANSALNSWLQAAGLSKGPVLRRVWKGQVGEEGLTPDHIHAIVKRAGERIGVPQLAPHDLRRTFARLALKGKAQLSQIQLTLGHSSVAITDRYLNSTVDLENPACDAIKLCQ
jgi:integrase